MSTSIFGIIRLLDEEWPQDGGAHAATEIIQKGLGNLQNIWMKAPSRQELWERATAQDGVLSRAGGRFWEGGQGGRTSATFERAPLPPGVLAAPTSEQASGGLTVTRGAT